MALLNRSLFILGAGASCSYGFPSGESLLSRISTIAKNEAASSSSVLDSALANRLANVIDQSRPPSIDWLLELHPDLAISGKYCIGQAICELETDTRIDKVKTNEDWYKWLFQSACRDCRSIFDLLDIFPKILTFNYDISLERYLYRCLRAMYGVSSELAIKVLRDLPIRHVYGTFGSIGQFADETCYKITMGQEEIYSKCQNIKTIHEVKTKSENDHVEWAYADVDNVAILGFGYHAENIELVGLRSCVQLIRRRGLRIISSCYSMGTAYVEAISQLFGDPGPALCRLGRHEWMCLETLKELFPVTL